MSEPYHRLVTVLTEQRDTLRRRVQADRERIAAERREAYRRGYAAGYHAAKRAHDHDRAAA